MDRSFYSYIWLREDGTPYYVGKGKGRRAFDKILHNVSCPADRSRILIFPQDSEADAFESERAIITLFGRKDLGTGCLRNLTDGGEGTTGHKGQKRTEDCRQKMRDAAALRHPVSLETRKRLSMALMGNCNRQGIPDSEDTKRKKSAIAKRRGISIETRNKMQASLIRDKQNGRFLCLSDPIPAPAV